jgi:hypothetical protein
VSDHVCHEPLSFARFADYWFGDLEASAQHHLEEQLFACPACGTQAEVWSSDLVALGEGSRQLSRGYLSPEQVVALGDRAAVVDVTAPEISVALADHAVQVLRVTLDERVRSELDRLDVEYLQQGAPEPIFHVSDVPLGRDDGRVHLACSTHILRAQGDTTLRVIGTRAGRQVTLLESLLRMH